MSRKQILVLSFLGKCQHEHLCSCPVIVHSGVGCLGRCQEVLKGKSYRMLTQAERLGVSVA